MALSGEAQATVRVVPDPTFDCTDVLGKVFDDANRDGVQNPGERGLGNVRVATARGLLATTDRHGRFHITCAVVPREDRGSNFILKLDGRTLPSGYRMTTRETQVKRATRGKALRFQFGAAIHRVVGLDLADAVFEPDTTKIRKQWEPRLELLIDELVKQPAMLRLSYVADLEEASLVERRVREVKRRIEDAWMERGGEPLAIETEVFWRRGGPGAKASGAFDGLLPSVDAGPPVEDVRQGEAVERHLPIDESFTQWSQDPALLDNTAGDRIEEREVVSEEAVIVKLKGVVAANPLRVGGRRDSAEHDRHAAERARRHAPPAQRTPPPRGPRRRPGAVAEPGPRVRRQRGAVTRARGRGGGVHPGRPGPPARGDLVLLGRRH